VRPPPDVEINAPEFPPRLRWLNGPPVRMDAVRGQPVLLEFWDFARVNSLRTLPYVRTWHERYAPSGLQVIGVHAPGYSFGRDPDLVEGAVGRLEVSHPVVLDPELAVWRLYGNRGWPARYLFGPTGALRHLHYGEGAYRDTELAIHDALLETDADLALPEPMAALRPEDEPEAVLEPQTADIALPADRERLELVRDWVDGEDYIEAKDPGAAAAFAFSAGGAFAVMSGAVAPGVYEVEGTVVADDPGLRLHGVQFTPLPPRPPPDRP
jgi:hypothetical protein